MMTFTTVSPARRSAVKSPVRSVPVVTSWPRAVPFTVRWVLPLASPDTVRSLWLSTWLVAPSRRVTVPVTETWVLIELVVWLSKADCTLPFASRYWADRRMVSPFRVIGGQTTRPLPLSKLQFPAPSPSPSGRWPKWSPNPSPMNPPWRPPIMNPIGPPAGPRPNS
jgi:hypothetical protein